MIAGLYNILIGIISPTLVGWILVRQLYRSRPTKDVMAQIAYSFMVGYGIINLIFTLNITLGYGFNNYLAYIIMGMGIIHFIFSLKRYSLIGIKNAIQNVNKLIINNKLICTALLIGISAIIFSANWPVRDWDSIALYDFRAKVFAQGLRMEDLQNVMSSNYYYRYYFVYPYMTSIAHAWTYIFNATTPIPIYAGFYVSIILLFLNFAHNAKNKINSQLKIYGTIFLVIPIVVALTPEILSHTSVAYTNLPYTAFFLASLIPLVNLNFDKLNEEKNIYQNYFLSALMLSSAVLTRFTEPFYISVIMVAIFQAIKYRKILLVFIYPFIIYMIRKLWMSYVTFGDELSIKAIPSVIANFNLDFFYQVEKFLLSHYLVNISMPLFIMCIFFLAHLVKTKKLDPLFIVFWGINIGILFIGGFFFAARLDIWKDIGGSAERMVMVLIPVFYYWALYLFRKSTEDI